MSRAARAAALAMLLAALLVPGVGAPSVASAADPGPTPVGTDGGKAQVNINEIEEEVMCPVCGTLLGLADSGQAQREKVFVGKLIEEGKSKDQIKDALVAEYGTSVLALPQESGFELSAYLVPIIGFVIAALALGFAVFRWRKSGSRGGRPAPAGGLSDDERERLDADIGRYDL